MDTYYTVEFLNPRLPEPSEWRMIGVRGKDSKPTEKLTASQAQWWQYRIARAGYECRVREDMRMPHTYRLSFKLKDRDNWVPWYDEKSGRGELSYEETQDALTHLHPSVFHVHIFDLTEQVDCDREEFDV